MFMEYISTRQNCIMNTWTTKLDSLNFLGTEAILAMGVHCNIVPQNADQQPLIVLNLDHLFWKERYCSWNLTITFFMYKGKGYQYLAFSLKSNSLSIKECSQISRCAFLMQKSMMKSFNVPDRRHSLRNSMGIEDWYGNLEANTCAWDNSNHHWRDSSIMKSSGHKDVWEGDFLSYPYLTKKTRHPHLSMYLVNLMSIATYV